MRFIDLDRAMNAPVVGQFNTDVHYTSTSTQLMPFPDLNIKHLITIVWLGLTLANLNIVKWYGMVII